MVKISIIVPVFNDESYLDDCLDSIINQTLHDIEIICVDDCSTDNSLKILRDYEKKDSRIMVLKHDSNKGRGTSRNTGMKYASGEYIGFVDSDDFIDKNMCLKLYEKAHTLNLDLLFFKIILFDNETGKKDFDSSNFSLKQFNGFNKDIFNHNDTKKFTCNLSVFPCSILYNRQFLYNHNFFFEEDMIFEEEPFFYNVYLNAERVSLLNESFYFYRQYHNSLLSGEESCEDIVKAFKKVRNAFIDSNNYTCEYKKILFQRFFHVVLNVFSLVHDKNIKEKFFLKIKNDFQEVINSINDFNLLPSDLKITVLNISFSNDFNEFQNFEKNMVIQTHTMEEICNFYKLSIILPIYNMEKHIHHAMYSIINQSLDFSSIEVLLVDDKSSDNTCEIIHEYMDKYDNVKGIFLKENSGFAGKPRNIGIEYASSDYVMFLDPDDSYEQNACELLYNEISHYKLDVVSGNFSDVEFYGGKKYNWAEKFGLQGYRFKVNSIKENIKLLDVYPSIWTKIYRRDFLIDNNIKFPEYLPGQDLYFNFVSLFKAEGISFIDESIVRYVARSHDDDLSVSCNDSCEVLIGLIEVYTRLYIFLDNFDYNYSWHVLKQLRYYWIQRFVNANLEFNELKQIVDKGSFLFKEYLNSNNIKPEIHNPIFNYIANKEYMDLFNELSRLNDYYVEKYLLTVIVIDDNSQYSADKLFNSILNQTIGFDNIEIIFIQNNLEKNSILDYAKKYKNVKFVERSNNYNKMFDEIISRVSSDYLIFANYSLPYINNSLEILFRNIAGGDFDFVSGNYLESLDASVDKKSMERLLFNNHSLWSKLFKKSFILEKNLSFDQSMDYYSIIFVEYCIFSSNNFKFINVPVFYKKDDPLFYLF